MDKLKMHTPNKADENFAMLAAMFPNAVTETINENGEVVRAIDKDVLMQEISTAVVDGAEERYQFTWPDKKKAVLAANSPIAKTLRPCRKESVDFDNTENLYIEGDNLDVLKLLQETYLGKVKMIYIDPPYNTGNDFVYNDDFAENTEDYLDRSGQFDEEGNRLVLNTESNGRFHTDWLNMIYPRLRLAKDLLTDDGVIFISIDDNEVENLRKAADDVFGTANFVSTIIWEKKYAPANDAKWLSDNHDYVLLYAKNKMLWHPQLLPRSAEMNSRYINRDNDPRGAWKSSDLSVKTYSAAYDYPITTPSGRIVTPPSGACWRVSKEKFKEMVNDNRIWFGEDGNNTPSIKRFLSEVKDGITPTTLWKYDEVGHNQEGRQEVKKVFDDKGYFDGPKPVRLINRMLKIANLEKDSIILDFFSGSATTAHAVMQLNAEDGGNRKFIMVQLPEETDEKSEAFKAGYKNICEIGKERIRRAGTKIKQSLNEDGTDIRHIAKHLPNADQLELIPGISVPVIPARWSTDESDERDNKQMADELDTGFRVLKLDSTNMKDVYYNPDELTIETLMGTVDNIKEDRTPEDLLFQVMLDLGVLLSSKIEQTVIGGKTVYNVADGFLIACFDENVTEETITAVAKMKPYYFVMRDSSMASDSVAANFDQIFEAYSKDTVRRVL